MQNRDGAGRKVRRLTPYNPICIHEYAPLRMRNARCQQHRQCRRRRWQQRRPICQMRNVFFKPWAHWAHGCASVSHSTYTFRHFHLPTLALSLYISGAVSRARRRQNDYDNGDNDSIDIRVRKHIDSMYEIASPCLQTSLATSHCHSNTNQSKHPAPFSPITTPTHTTHHAMRRNLDVVLFTQVDRVTDLSISLPCANQFRLRYLVTGCRQ